MSSKPRKASSPANEWSPSERKITESTNQRQSRCTRVVTRTKLTPPPPPPQPRKTSQRIGFMLPAGLTHPPLAQQVVSRMLESSREFKHAIHSSCAANLYSSLAPRNSFRNILIQFNKTGSECLLLCGRLERDHLLRQRKRTLRLDLPPSSCDLDLPPKGRLSGGLKEGFGLILPEARRADPIGGAHNPKENLPELRHILIRDESLYPVRSTAASA